MGIGSRFSLFVALLSFGVSFGALAEQCSSDVAFNLFQREIPAWDYSRREAPELTPADFLPADYLTKLKDQFGGSDLRITPTKVSANGTTVYEFRLTLPKSANQFDTEVVRFDFWQGSTPDSVVIEHLNANDFTAEKDYRRLRGSQTAKGLPKDVFQHTVKRALYFLKRGGFKRLETETIQDYMTHVLYRRLVGLKSASPLGEEIMSRMDRAFNVLRKHPNPAIQVSGLDEFSRIPGDIKGWQSVYGDMLDEIRNFKERGKFSMPNAFTWIEDGGEKLGLVFIPPSGYSKSTSRKKIMLFLPDENGKMGDILLWARLFGDPKNFEKMKLSREL